MNVPTEAGTVGRCPHGNAPRGGSSTSYAEKSFASVRLPEEGRDLRRLVPETRAILESGHSDPGEESNGEAEMMKPHRHRQGFSVIVCGFAAGQTTFHSQEAFRVTPVWKCLGQMFRRSGLGDEPR